MVKPTEQDYERMFRSLWGCSPSDDQRQRFRQASAKEKEKILRDTKAAAQKIQDALRGF